MSDYRRAFVPGGTYFFTVVTHRGRRLFHWQRRFWEHWIADEDDFQTDFDYIHFNPVKYRLVKSTRECGPSSFHRWVERGV
jgi:putative transposase